MQKEQGKVKYLLKHRIAYWVKTGQYPELVRDICDNALDLDKGAIL